MGKNSTVSRRVDGFVWLTKHARRGEIVAYVTGARDAAPEWLRHDRVFPKVQRDRSVWKAANLTAGRQPPLRNDARESGEGSDCMSLREVAAVATAAGFDVSYQMVRNILDVYDNGGPPRREDQERLKLRSHARRAITRDVIAQFDAQQLTAAQVAERIGHGADYRNAAYWIDRMREVYAAQDAAASQ